MHHKTKILRLAPVGATVLATLLVCVCSFGPASAQCIDYQDYLHWAGSVETPGLAFDVALSGTHAYVADGHSGLQVTDIRNPSNPQQVGSLQTPDFALGVALLGAHAYVADFGSGLQVIDITNLANPQIIGSVETQGYACAVAVSGTHAYVADRQSGLQVIDITNPANPQLVGSVETPGLAFDVAVSGTHAYVADYESGLQVLPLQCEAASAVEMELPAKVSRLFDAYPNPFNPQTTLAFELPKQGVVSLRVLDLSGRLVRALLDGITVAEGRQEVIWNGRDDTGRRVSSGTYFYRLEAGEYSETKRMVLIK